MPYHYLAPSLQLIGHADFWRPAGSGCRPVRGRRRSNPAQAYVVDPRDAWLGRVDCRFPARCNLSASLRLSAIRPRRWKTAVLISSCGPAARGTGSIRQSPLLAQLRTALGQVTVRDCRPSRRAPEIPGMQGKAVASDRRSPARSASSQEFRPRLDLRALPRWCRCIRCCRGCR